MQRAREEFYRDLLVGGEACDEETNRLAPSGLRRTAKADSQPSVLVVVSQIGDPMRAMAEAEDVASI